VGKIEASDVSAQFPCPQNLESEVQIHKQHLFLVNGGFVTFQQVGKRPTGENHSQVSALQSSYDCQIRTIKLAMI